LRPFSLGQERHGTTGARASCRDRRGRGCTRTTIAGNLGSVPGPRNFPEALAKFGLMRNGKHFRHGAVAAILVLRALATYCPRFVIHITSHRHSSQEDLESKTRISTSISMNNSRIPNTISPTEIHGEADMRAADPLPHRS